MKSLLILTVLAFVMGCTHEPDKNEIILADVLAAERWTVVMNGDTFTGNVPVGETLTVPDGVHELTLSGGVQNAACVTVYVLGGEMLATDTCHIGDAPVVVRW